MAFRRLESGELQKLTKKIDKASTFTVKVLEVVRRWIHGTASGLHGAPRRTFLRHQEEAGC